MGQLEEGIIQQGNENISVIRDGDLVYRAQPIQTFQDLVFHALEADVPKLYKLSDFIDADLELVGVIVDLDFDDTLPAENVSTIDEDYSLQLEIKLLKDSRVYSRIRLGLSSGRIQTALFFLKPEEEIQITSRRAARNVTFTCRQVNLRPSINVYPVAAS